MCGFVGNMNVAQLKLLAYDMKCFFSTGKSFDVIQYCNANKLTMYIECQETESRESFRTVAGITVFAIPSIPRLLAGTSSDNMQIILHWKKIASLYQPR